MSDDLALTRQRNEGHKARLFLENPAFRESVERCRELYVKMFMDSTTGPDGLNEREAAHGRLRCMGDLLTDLTRIARKGDEANEKLKAEPQKVSATP